MAHSHSIETTAEITKNTVPAISLSTLTERLKRHQSGDTRVPHLSEWVHERFERLKARLNAVSTDEVSVSSITHDSRRVERGSIYVALVGRVTHGARFIDQALERGAVAIALPLDTPDELWAALEDDATPLPPILWLTPDRARHEMAWLAAWVYRSAPPLAQRGAEPQAQADMLELIGLTGTNGKTTTSTLLADILKEAEGDVGLIGTIETRGGGHQARAAQMTTMESPDLHAHYRALINAGVKRCVMEVSSIGIEEERVSASRYARAALLNLSPDHLDYHEDMKRYARAKLRLFGELLAPHALAVICVDGDHISNEAAAEAITLTQAQGCDVWRVAGRAALPASTTPASTPEVYWRELELTLDGISGHVVTPRGEVAVCSPLIGRFNASNIAVAVALATSLEVPSEVISYALKSSAARGRMELITSDAPGPSVRVDYAHSPDAIERALEALREHQPSDGTSASRAWVLFGCGGTRDAQKRPLMGAAAARADGVVLTSDNPRDEDPESIAGEALVGAVKSGLSQTAHPEVGGVWVELDRGVAIQQLIRVARPEDQLLIAGKGHEPYQELAQGVRVPFSDQEHARCALEARAWLAAQQSALGVDELSLSTAALCQDAGGLLRAGAHQVLSGAAIDTRKITRQDRSDPQSAHLRPHQTSARGVGPAFFCLRGARDGHDFIEVALDAGAAAIVVRRSFEASADLRARVERQHATLIEVNDPQVALARWASAHRRRVFSGVMIGLTGSNGKTSTKDLIASALSALGATLATSGNFNNHLGVPLTLLRLRASHEFAVIEMGMNAPDEIRQLTRWAKPDLGVITTIAPAHLEKLGSIEAVARAKGELISELNGPVLIPQSVSQHLRGEAAREWVHQAQADQLEATPETPLECSTRGVYVLPMNDEDARATEPDSKLLAHERFIWPPLQIRGAQMSLDGGVAQLEPLDHLSGDQEVKLGVSRRPLLRTQLRGRHQLENARIGLAAALAAVAMSGKRPPKLWHPRAIDAGQLQLLLEGLARCAPAPLRGELSAYHRPRDLHSSRVSDPAGEEVSAEGLLWLDCYNANPQSVLASLHTFFDCGLSGALVLGSIGELGATSAELHYGLGQQVAHLLDASRPMSLSERSLDTVHTAVFTVGEDARHLARGFTQVGGAHLGHFDPDDLESLVEGLRALNPPSIFVKGSRSVRLERIAELLQVHELTPLSVRQ